MTEIDAELRDWTMADTGSGLRISGAIYGDRLTSGKHPFPDGERVCTSRVVCFDAGVAVTASGTRYRLAAANPPSPAPPTNDVAGFQTEPESVAEIEGRWINADDVERLVKQLDIAVNGSGGALHPKLCDVVGQIIHQGLVVRPAPAAGSAEVLNDEDRDAIHNAQNDLADIRARILEGKYRSNLSDTERLRNHLSRMLKLVGSGALSALPVPDDGWRDMASAPKDETNILVYFTSKTGRLEGAYRVAWVSIHGETTAEDGIWCVDDEKHGPYALRGWCAGDDIAWRPLPAPPGQEGK